MCVWNFIANKRIWYMKQKNSKINKQTKLYKNFTIKLIRLFGTATDSKKINEKQLEQRQWQQIYSSIASHRVASWLPFASYHLESHQIVHRRQHWLHDKITATAIDTAWILFYHCTFTHQFYINISASYFILV